jgi:hypothetical protein
MLPLIDATGENYLSQSHLHRKRKGKRNMSKMTAQALLCSNFTHYFWTLLITWSG